MDTNLLNISETFHSIQGEGQHAGRSAFFLRTQGCSVGCTWCDTKYSWLKTEAIRDIAVLHEEALNAVESGAEIIVVTGGEPLEQNLENLCASLKTLSIPIHLETSGTRPLSGAFDWITLSPKPHKPPLPEILRLCDELKVVTTCADDLKFAEMMRKELIKLREGTSSMCHLFYLQPEWDNPIALSETLRFVKKENPWRLSLQTHKMVNIP